MKKLLISALILMLVVPFSGCKKGEEDPGISLRSRDSRVEGTWKLSKIESTETEVDKTSTSTDTEITTTTITIAYDGTDITTTTLVKDESGGTTESNITKIVDTYSVSVTINKDNTYTYNTSKTNKTSCTADASDCTPVTTAFIGTYTDKDNGEWFWLDANDEQINLFTAAPYFSGKLKKCSNSELIFEETKDVLETTSYTGFTNEISTVSTKTYTWIAE